jgi:hypothetical protein
MIKMEILRKKGEVFFVDQNGGVITSRYVLLNATEAKVKTAQGEIYPITQILAEDSYANIVRVLVDIPPEKVKPLKVKPSFPVENERIVITNRRSR